MFYWGKSTTRKHRGTEIVVRPPSYVAKHVHSHPCNESVTSTLNRFLRFAPLLIHDVVYGVVLGFFGHVNRKAGKKLALWAMKLETFQHLYALTDVFKWIVLPASILYVCLEFCLFGQNALDSMSLGMLVFVYSTFLPDLPSICRKRKTYTDTGAVTENLSWYRKCALLLFAPLFIGAALLGVPSKWRTIETFHNFKWLLVYGAFLLTLGTFVFSDFPISIGGLGEMISLPIYGLAGYLTHLKVDLIF